ncbi:hypothetical protein LTS18_012862, partial [Coniosporium uncinatum]
MSSSPTGPSFSTLSLASAHPFLTLLSLILLTCLFTRLSSSYRYHNPSSPHSVRTLPYSLPYLGHAPQFGLGVQAYLIALARAHPHLPSWALHVAGQKFNFVLAPSLARQILNAAATVLTGDEATCDFLTKFFGDGGRTREVDGGLAWGLNHRTFNLLVREPWLGAASGGLVVGIGGRVPRLVGVGGGGRVKVEVEGKGDGLGRELTSWEKSGNVVRGDGYADADLLPLLRTLIGEVALAALMGRKFLEKHPGFLEDMWAWDERFKMYLAGVPTWMPGLRGATKARTRMLEALAGFLDVLNGHVEGVGVAAEWGGLEDVSQVMFER